MLFFGSAPSAKDEVDFCSSEYADITVDEAQEFAQDELERLAGSNRCTSNPDITAKMVADLAEALRLEVVPRSLR